MSCPGKIQASVGVAAKGQYIKTNCYSFPQRHRLGAVLYKTWFADLGSGQMRAPEMQNGRDAAAGIPATRCTIPH